MAFLGTPPRLGKYYENSKFIASRLAAINGQEDVYSTTHISYMNSNFQFSFDPFEKAKGPFDCRKNEKWCGPHCSKENKVRLLWSFLFPLAYNQNFKNSRSKVRQRIQDEYIMVSSFYQHGHHHQSPKKKKKMPNRALTTHKKQGSSCNGTTGPSGPPSHGLMTSPDYTTYDTLKGTPTSNATPTYNCTWS